MERLSNYFDSMQLLITVKYHAVLVFEHLCYWLIVQSCIGLGYGSGIQVSDCLIPK